MPPEIASLRHGQAARRAPARLGPGGSLGRRGVRCGLHQHRPRRRPHRAERLREAIQTWSVANDAGERIPVTASIGLAARHAGEPLRKPHQPSRSRDVRGKGLRSKQGQCLPKTVTRGTLVGERRMTMPEPRSLPSSALRETPCECSAVWRGLRRSTGSGGRWGVWFVLPCWLVGATLLGRHLIALPRPSRRRRAGAGHGVRCAGRRPPGAGWWSTFSTPNAQCSQTNCRPSPGRQPPAGRDGARSPDRP